MSAVDQEFLDPFEAALFLGITPELLFAYVRYAPKGEAGGNRRLVAVQDNGHTRFRRSDLESFDLYLQEPWSEPGEPRAGIPPYLVAHLRVESGGGCARCGRGSIIETAHICEYSQSRSHHHHNLIRLCTQCHGEFDSKVIVPTGEIRELKDRLIARTRERLSLRIAGSNAEVFRLPNPAPIFLGRELLIRAVIDSIAAARVVCLKGPGGIGKTQLALHAIRQWSSQSRARWIEMEPLKTIEDLRATLSTALSLPSMSSLDAIAKQLGADVDILVFDGIEALAREDLDLFEDLLSQLLARAASVRFLITSQVELLNVEGLLNIEVTPLDLVASLGILRSDAEEHLYDTSTGTMGDVDWLVHFSDGHPLTLRIVASLLRYFKSASTVARRVKLKGASNVANPTRTRKTKRTSLDACLTVAYDALQPAERRLLYVLAHCPSGRFAPHFDFDRMGIEDGEVAVAELARWHFISVDTSWEPIPRLNVISPIRSFALAKFETQESDLAKELFWAHTLDIEVQAAVLDAKYTSEGEVDVGHGTFRIDTEFPNFGHVFDESIRRSDSNPEYLRVACSLALTLQVFCFVTGRSARGFEMLNGGVAAALQLGNPALASSLLLQVANFAARKGDVEGARKAYRRLIDLPLDTSDPHLVGNIQFARGKLAIDAGSPEIAEQHFMSASEQYALPGGPLRDRHGDAAETRMHALSLMECAMLHEHSDRAGTALELYGRCLSLMRQSRDRVNMGAVLHQMGNCYGMSGAFDAAYGAYVEAIKHFFQLRSAIHLSNSMSELGYLLIDHDPGLRLCTDITDDIIHAGLADMYRECAARFNPSLNFLGGEDCDRMGMRKLVGTMSLLSFTSHVALLREFADHLANTLSVPLIEQYRAGSRRAPQERNAIVRLHLTIALIGSLPNIDLQRRAEIDEIAHLADLCYTQGEFAWVAFRLFDWLAAFLRRRRGWPEVTANDLRCGMTDLNLFGEPFTLA